MAKRPIDPKVQAYNERMAQERAARQKAFQQAREQEIGEQHQQRLAEKRAKEFARKTAARFSVDGGKNAFSLARRMDRLVGKMAPARHKKKASIPFNPHLVSRKKRADEDGIYRYDGGVLTIDAFQEALDAIGGDIEKWGSRVYRAYTEDLFTTIVEGTPFDTGHARNNWQIGLNVVPANEIYFAMGQFRPMTMEIAKIRQADIFLQRVYIVNNVPYIAVLDAGYSPQAPMGITQPAIAWVNAAYTDARVEEVALSQDSPLNEFEGDRVPTGRSLETPWGDVPLHERGRETRQLGNTPGTVGYRPPRSSASPNRGDYEDVDLNKPTSKKALENYRRAQRNFQDPYHE
jgi:hypothetical protein